MLKLEQGKKSSNAARQHKGLHVRFLIPKNDFKLKNLIQGYVGISQYL
jgi:hypothetical protein